MAIGLVCPLDVAVGHCARNPYRLAVRHEPCQGGHQAAAAARYLAVIAERNWAAV
jgi:hypothetical protein